jgi:hypothetical protein
MAKSDKKAGKDVGKKMFDDVTNSSVDARNAVDEFYNSDARKAFGKKYGYKD